MPLYGLGGATCRTFRQLKEKDRAMNTFLLFVGIALSSQVVDSGDSRYQGFGNTSDSSPQFKTDAPESSEQLFNQTPGENAEIAKPLPNRTTAKTPEGKPSQLLETLAEHPPTSELKGKPLLLSDALLTANSREAQSRRVQLYWDLANAVMECDLAQRELTEIATLQQSILQPGSVWVETHSTAKANYQTKLATAKALQLRLQAELNSSELPLPSDLPLCGAYKTLYQELFASRPNAEAEALDQLLDWEYTNLRSIAGSVVAARKWLDMVSAQRSTQSDGTELLQSYLSFANSRRLFLQAVHDYNDHIVRYTELAAPGNVGTQRLVAMLIKTDVANWNQSDIQQATAEEDLQESSSQQVVPRTYENPGRSQTNRVPADESGEHSILVQ